MKKLSATFYFLIGIISYASIGVAEEVNPIFNQVLTIGHEKNSCEAVDRSGSIDVWGCRDFDGKISCYTEYECEDGTSFTINHGPCVDSYADCW